MDNLHPWTRVAHRTSRAFPQLIREASITRKDAARCVWILALIAFAFAVGLVEHGQSAFPLRAAALWLPLILQSDAAKFLLVGFLTIYTTAVIAKRKTPFSPLYSLALCSSVLLSSFAYLNDFPTAAAKPEYINYLFGAAIGLTIADIAFARHMWLSKHLWVIFATIWVAALSCILIPEVPNGARFQFQGAPRNSGAFADPNLFGSICSAGFLLAFVGSLVSFQKLIRLARTHRFGQPLGLEIRLRTGFLGGLLLILVILLKAIVCSYSRGAWLGTLLGLFLVTTRLTKSAAEISEQKYQTWPSIILCTWIGAGGLLVLFMLAGITGLPGSVGRRFASLSNPTDLSRANRLLALEGELNMIRYQPWFGYGWEGARRSFDSRFAGHILRDAGAFETNGYLKIAVSAGIPAMLSVLLAAAVTLSSGSNLRINPTEVHRTLFRQSSLKGAPTSTLTTDWETEDLLHACRTAAVALAVAFWFNDVLFELPCAAIFWTLLSITSGICDSQCSRPIDS